VATANDPNKNPVIRFLNQNRACKPAIKWATPLVASGRITTFQDAWDQCPDPGWLLWALERAGYVDDPNQFAADPDTLAITHVYNSLNNLDLQMSFPDATSKTAYGTLTDYVNGQVNADLTTAQDQALQAAAAYGPLNIIEQRRAALALAATIDAVSGTWPAKVAKIDFATGLTADAAVCNSDGTIDNNRTKWDAWRNDQATELRGNMDPTDLQTLIDTLNAHFPPM
jgi:hypothetical protein